MWIVSPKVSLRQRTVSASPIPSGVGQRSRVRSIARGEYSTVLKESETMDLLSLIFAAALAVGAATDPADTPNIRSTIIDTGGN